MKKIRIGVFGVYRGSSMINYCRFADNAKVVAICDKWKEGLEKQKKMQDDPTITYYDNFDDFIKHDMDAVVLANYANEHAPFAIRAMEAGKAVFSEVLPCQTMKEAVELIECVERTGMTYAYGENYCYMPAPREMKKLFREGKFGEFDYGEGEYVHDCMPIWPSITYGQEDHWRNRMYSTFYCTHSLGPIVHITGLRPVSVIGFEGTHNERQLLLGSKSGQFGMEMITMENGGIYKSLHGNLRGGSIWYSLYGSKGFIESNREVKDSNGVLGVNIRMDLGEKIRYDVDFPEEYKIFGHGGSDYYTLWNFVEKLRGNPDADTIDVYEAMDMFLPGMFAYRSILAGNVKMDIPNLRNKDEREKWRNDTACSDPKVAGDMLLPTFSLGTPDIPKEVYDEVRETWLAEFNADEGYTKAAFRQSRKDKNK